MVVEARRPERRCGRRATARARRGRDAALRQRGLVTGGLTVSDLLRIPHAIDVRPADHQTGPAPAVADARERASTTRSMRSGHARNRGPASSSRPRRHRLATIAAFRRGARGAAEEGQRQLEARLRERLDDASADLQGDPAAVARELVRFRLAFRHRRGSRPPAQPPRALARPAVGAEPCGRKLDFLVQEMNREVNTIGSKVEMPGRPRWSSPRRPSSSASGSRSRMSSEPGPARSAVRHLGAVGHGKTTSSSGWSSAARSSRQSRSYTSRPAETAKLRASTIIS